MAEKRAKPQNGTKKKSKKKVASPARPKRPPARAPAATRVDKPPNEPRVHEGACHCGAIEYTYETAVPSRRWTVHLCQCTFCRGHGARNTFDPVGEVHFDFKLPEHLRRYRFGLRTADFLICRECGTYIAAVLMTGHGALTSINVNTLREIPADLPSGKPVSHEGESIEERRSRRAKVWTPVVGPV